MTLNLTFFWGKFVTFKDTYMNGVFPKNQTLYFFTVITTYTAFKTIL